MKTTLLFRYVIMFLYFTTVSVVAFAQAIPVKEWDYRFGGSGGDDMFDMQQTLDGGFILAGK